MPDSIFDCFLNPSPEELESQRIHEEKLRALRKLKIETAVMDKHIEYSLREHSQNQTGKQISQKFTLFLCTKEGIYGEPDTLGRLEYTIYKEAALEDIFLASKSRGVPMAGYMNKLIHFDIVAIYSDYRGYGLSEKLVSRFFEIYKENYSHFPISFEFMTPVAEKVIRKVAKEKHVSCFNERLIRRFFNENESGSSGE
ncbi:hypothetical protein QTG56_24295 (plasmid) [Rossellomorea sp. AcN35-11]|nr:hypothetical protein [Rossellomorea aquimaris]WJV31761.1 hypothetical protein QTG56_24295 [Rossellomorea sp. AcN35-11]